MHRLLHLILSIAVLGLAACGSLKFSIKNSAEQKKSRRAAAAESEEVGLTVPLRPEANPQLKRPPARVPNKRELAPAAETPLKESGAPDVGAPTATTTTSLEPSPARSAWLSDGRCYYCSGRGQKFEGSDFVTCPHCKGKGKR